MTFGMRLSCVATKRCGSSLARLDIVFAPGTKHNMREFCPDLQQWVQMGGFVLLRLECLRCLALQDLRMLVYPVSFPQSRGCQQSVRLVQRVVHVSTPSYVPLSPSQLSEDPSRTFDSHVSTRYSQLVSMASRHKPKRPVEKIPPSFLRRSLRDTAATGPSTSVT